MRDTLGRFLASPSAEEERWSSERIRAAHEVMLADIVVKTLWPRWFRGVCAGARLTMPKQLIAWPGEPYRLSAWARWGELGCFALPEADYPAWRGWALAHGEFNWMGSDREEEHAALRARYLGQPDPPVIAWVRSLPHRFQAHVGRCAVPEEDGLPPMLGPAVAPAERWTISMEGWKPCKPETPRLEAAPWDPWPSTCW